MAEEKNQSNRNSVIISVMLQYFYHYNRVIQCSDACSVSLLTVPHWLVHLKTSLAYIKALIIISAAGHAFLRPREDLRRVEERFARSLILKASHRLAFLKAS